MANGNSTLIPLTGSGWSRGLENALHGELSRWFSTRRWWSRILSGAAMINLVYLLVAIGTPKAQAGLDSTLLIFNIFMGLAGPISVAVAMQGALVGEKRYGTAAWVLSKPISRTAFILSKLIANSIGTAATMVLAQGVIAYLITSFLLGVNLPVVGFLAGLGIHLANLLFYLTLTLMLGTLFEQPGPVIGIPLAALFAQQFLISFYPPLARFLPWSLAIPVGNSVSSSLSMALMTGQPVATFLPLITALACSILFGVVALWVFERQEL